MTTFVVGRDRADSLVLRVPACAAQEPVSQENRRPRLNDRSRVSGTDECPNWTSSGNDRSGELDGNSWLASNVGSRCGVDGQPEKLIIVLV